MQQTDSFVVSRLGFNPTQSLSAKIKVSGVTSLPFSDYRFMPVGYLMCQVKTQSACLLKNGA
jgi:hypothetical protein